MVVEQLYPQTLPDLFAGSQLVLVGRYRDGGPAAITLRGTVNGEAKTFVYDDQFFRIRSGDEFIPRLWATRAIGHLLTEIRLHGENPELVQSVVNLSIRYGIITPYTSYLIEEDDIFTQAGRNIIVEEEMEEMLAEPAPVTGGAAVDEAAAAGELADAEAPFELPSSEGFAVEEVVRFVGSKTFVWRDGVWVDTGFDPDVYTTTPINFASDGYFELVTAVPQLAQYFAIGQRVIVVHEEAAYEIVESGGQESVPLPVTITIEETQTQPLAVTVTVETSQPLPTTAPTATPSPGNTPGSNMIAAATREGGTAVSNPSTNTGWGVFVGVLLALITLGAGVMIGRKGHS
jgi:Ca-activated chloride channel family protein